MKIVKLLINVILISLPLLVGFVYDWNLSDTIFSALFILLLLYPLKSYILFCGTIIVFATTVIAYLIGQKGIGSELSVWVFFLFVSSWLAVVWENALDGWVKIKEKNAK